MKIGVDVYSIYMPYIPSVISDSFDDTLTYSTYTGELYDRSSTRGVLRKDMGNWRVTNYNKARAMCIFTGMCNMLTSGLGTTLRRPENTSPLPCIEMSTSIMYGTSLHTVEFSILCFAYSLETAVFIAIGHLLWPVNGGAARSVHLFCLAPSGKQRVYEIIDSQWCLEYHLSQ